MTIMKDVLNDIAKINRWIGKHESNNTDVDIMAGIEECKAMSDELINCILEGDANE